jgi:dTDP-4-dehydrorhamnose reductase
VKKILLTGKDGQIGWELRRTLATLGEVVALDREAMDLANPESIRSVIREARPHLIVNAAAYTAVDKAESEPELAMAINGIAPGVMAEEAKRLNAAIIHYSTDYVFDGAKPSPYTEEDAPNPLNVYGRTKLAGERAIQAAGVPHLIFRTSWVYGARGRNFLLTILRLLRERDELKIVDDQIGAPTWSRMIAEATGQILAQCLFSSLSPRQRGGFAAALAEYGGLYHLTSGGQTSWHGFAKAILEAVPPSTFRQPLPRLTPVSTAAYPLPARRPPNSVMSNGKLKQIFGIALPAWDAALALCLRDFPGNP